MTPIRLVLRLAHDKETRMRIAILACAIGAGALAPADTIHVPADFGTIQEAIVSAFDGDAIHVAPGEYFEPIDFLGRNVHLVGAGAELTTINATGQQVPAVRFVSGEGPGAVIEGFTIAHAEMDEGAGVLISGAWPTIAGCVLRNNTALIRAGAMLVADGGAQVVDTVFDANKALGEVGGAAAIAHSDVRFTRCTFTSNEATIAGGAVRMLDSRVRFDDCEFIGNKCASLGGAVYVDRSAPVFVRTRFVLNTGGVMAGAVYTCDSDPSFDSCVFRLNKAGDLGGAVVVQLGGPVEVHGCTFFDNDCEIGADAVATVDGGKVMLANSIVWGHDLPALQGDVAGVYCAVEGGMPGAGNIDADPLLDDALRLQPGSPCIDAGNTAVVRSPLDAASARRAVDHSATPDTGLGVAGAVVDMGAFEFGGAGCTADVNADGVLNILDFVAYQGLFTLGCP
jgi:hypothetical protein